MSRPAREAASQVEQGSTSELLAETNGPNSTSELLFFPAYAVI